MTALLIFVILLLIFGIGGLIKGVLWLALLCAALILAGVVLGWVRYGADRASRQ